jgi:hypothetical protein
MQDEGLTCQASLNILSFLAGALLNYQEEGVNLSPHIVFCQGIDEVVRAFPGSVKHVIGEVPLSPESAKRILKDCAPLAIRNWCLYLERPNSTALRYGVFSYIKLPTTLPLEQAVSVLEGVFCILLRKKSPSVIEMCGSSGHTLSLTFSTVREEDEPSNPVAQFAKDCCRDLEGARTSGFEDYFCDFLEHALAESHGTILVCALPQQLGSIQDFKPGTLLQPTLDLAVAFSEWREANSAKSILNLQSCEELLKGFIDCDGIVAFDTSTKALAYRVMYRPSKPATDSETQAVGGARRRAFEGIRTLVGGQLVSALFRSQDGFTEHAGVKDE